MHDFNENWRKIDAYLNWPDIAGRFTIGCTNANGETLLQLCALNGLSIIKLCYAGKSTSRYT